MATSQSNCPHLDGIIEIVTDTTNPIIYERECLDCGYLDQGYLVETIRGKKKFFIPMDSVPDLMEVADEVDFYNGEINT